MKCFDVRAALGAVLLAGMLCGCGKDEPAPPGGGEGGAAGAGQGGEAKAPAPGETRKGPVKLPAPVMTAQKGKTYRHVAGFSFKYPADWTLKEHPNFLQLVPPNEKKNAAGPTEAYLIVGEGVGDEGITSAADPRVATYLDGQMRQLSPTLVRQPGAPTVPLSAGRGTVYTWKGRNAQGQAITARAYTCIVNRWGTALVALGLEGNVEAREEQVRKVFGSFGFGAGKRDAQLVGKWVLRSTSAIQNNSPFETAWSRAQAVSENRSWITFSPDGTWKRLDKYHMLAGAGGLWIEDKKNTVSEGTWSAGDGVLFLTWKDGGWNDYKYQVQTAGGGRRLRLVSEKRGEIWEPSQ